MGWCPYDGEECHHDGYCSDCEHSKEQVGEWKTINGDGSLWKCSNCGELSCCKGNFCPDCGADMRGKLQANDEQVKEVIK